MPVDQSVTPAARAGFRRASLPLLALALGLMTTLPAQADNKSSTTVKTTAADPCAFAADDRLSLLDNRLASLQEKLALQPSQTAAWKTWVKAVRDDVTKQSAEECRINQQWWESMRTQEIDLSTPERLKRQEDGLRTQLAMIQARLDQIEAAEKNTVPFYDILDQKQKTIFDLFWRLEHATSFHPTGMNRMRGPGTGVSPFSAAPHKGPVGTSASPAP